MSRECTVCAHPDRARVELALANRVPMRTVARRYTLSKEAAYRHRRGHMPPQLIAALMLRGRPTDVDLDKLRITESEGLLQHLVAQRGRLYKLADAAEDLGDINAATRVHGQLSRNLELTGKLLGELRTGSQSVVQNILIAPQYHQMRVALVQALRPFPDARTAVAAVLHKIEGEAAPPIEMIE